MNERQELILETIIQEHVASGIPVSSSILVDKYNLDISSATVRNEMAVLEEQGYIIQPHTSAGRIPTAKAYQWLADRIKGEQTTGQERKSLAGSLSGFDENSFKNTAKILAELSGQGVFWAMHRHHVYYTGITNLLSQPEFMSHNLLYNLSTVIDHLDEIVNDYFEQIVEEPRILIGPDNPFGEFCSAIVFKYKAEEFEGAVGLIAPLRADYEKNLSLIKFIKDILCQKKKK